MVLDIIYRIGSLLQPSTGNSIFRYFYFIAKMHKPLLIVLGATGAGKSKLALDIAQHIDAEIINADAMQMYKGLDIVTNKVTPDETKICPHHLIGFLSPRQQFTIVDFQQQALDLINDIHGRNKVPILVGGTNYYVESILWETLIRKKGDKLPSDGLVASVNETRKELYELSNAEVHKKLESLDPQMAASTHPNNKRKVIRAIEVYYQTGLPMSKHLSDQRLKSGGSNIGGPLRFPNSCAIWVQCEPEILRNRIRKRIETMVSRGLLQELADFHEEYNKERLKDGLEPEYEHGIFQSIGFKEFHQYLTSDNHANKEKLLSEGIERMNLSTWQYAKYQQKWIKKRIVNRSSTIPVFGFDGSDPSQWDTVVLNPALGVVKSFYSDHPEITEQLKNISTEDTLLPEPIETDASLETKNDRSFKKCSICGGKLIPSSQWDTHAKSKKHKRTYGLLKKQQEQTVRILTKRQRQLSQSHSENNQEINIESANESINTAAN